MAARRPSDGDHNHERLYVKVQREERKLIPPVQLARQEIRMTYLPSEQPVPCIITTSSEESRRHEAQLQRIVGTEAGPPGSSVHVTQHGASGALQQMHHASAITTSVVQVSSVATTAATTRSQLTVEYKSSSAATQSSTTERRQEVETPHDHVLQFFEEQGKNIMEQHHSRTQATATLRQKRSPSPSPVRQSVGLDHLDNLVKLMEQLSSLRDENLKLKKKCEYLESTKSLLQVKSAVDSELALLTGLSSVPKIKGKSKSVGHGRGSRPRLLSADDSHSIESVETSSDVSPKRPKTALSVRSHSTGSLDIPSDIMEQSGEEEIPEKIILSKSYEKRPGRSASKGSKSPSAKRKSKISNWSKIIKVLTRQKPDDIGISVRTKKDLAPSVTLPSSSAKELTVPSSSAVDGKSVDSGMGSGLEADVQDGQRRSTSSGEPISPSSQSPSHEEGTRTDELTSEIWMGPPEWLEEHEDELATPTSCLEQKEVIILKSAADRQIEKERYLQVQFPRRKSSPSLHDRDDKSSESSEEESYTPLRRSSSCKEQTTTGEEIKEQFIGSPKPGKKFHQKTIGKVMKMVHTRKDSIKKKLKKSSTKPDVDQQSGEELSEIDVENYEDVLEEEGPLGRSTPKTSPMAIRQNQQLREGKSAATMLGQLGGSIDVSALMGGMSDEFSRKWKQWEELQTKRLSTPQKDSGEYSEGPPPESLGAVSPEFQKKLEEWERTKSIKSRHLEETPARDSREGSPEGLVTPPDGQSQAVNIEEIQKRLTDSFSRKMEEWEKRKYRKEGSPSMDRKDSSSKLISRKDDRQKSKRSKEDKDREKMEKQRERELQRVEREQHKLEKEKLRLEKERLKALEREARLEKMKGRLSQPDMESKFKNPILSPLAEYKVTSDFAKKLHEWELRRGQASSVSMATYLETQQKSLEAGDFSPPKKDGFSLEDQPGPSSGRKLAKGQKPPPLTLLPCTDSPEEISPGARSRSSLESFGEETSVTMESMTEANISSLEKANARLLEELHEKESEYANLQEEVQDLTEKLNKARIQHSKEIEQYKRECLTGGTVTPASPLVVSNEMTDLEGKIQDLKCFGENLAETMESAAVCKMQSMEGEESVNTQLMELLEQMRLMLLRASQSVEVYQKTTALHSFEKLYSQAMQLQVQLSNLRLSQIERNKEIMSMKRQLLLQEANNLLLQADITRRETELIRYKHYAKGTTQIKRWNTYGGMEGRVVEGQALECVPPYKRFTKGRKAEQQPPIRMEEEVAEQATSRETRAPAEVSLSGKIKTSIHSSSALSSAVEHTFEEPQYTVKTLEDQRLEKATEVDYIAKHLEEPETFESTIVMQGQREEDLTIRGEKGVEISLMIKLPTASVSLPKDISQQELTVPRSQRGVESDQNLSQPTPGGTKSEAKFPELLIPEWKKSSKKGCLLKIQSVDIQEEDEKAQSDSAILCKTERTFQPTVVGSTESPNYIVTFPEDQVQEEETNKRHTYPRASDMHAETIIVTKADMQTSVTLSPIISRRLADTHVHWPNIGHITSVNRIRPADELLQESRRYRKGHSIYMERILQKYSLSDKSKKYFDEKHLGHDKENLSRGYVKTIVKRLSRETTPDDDRIRSSSDTNVKQGTTITVHKTDSPRTRSEFVQHIVRKLSSPGGPDQSGRLVTAPLKDLTNGGGQKVKKLAEAFDSGSSRTSTPERVISKVEYHPTKSAIVGGKGKSHDPYGSSSSSSTYTTTKSFPSSHGREVFPSYEKPDSTISETVMNFSSMPLLSVKEEETDEAQNGYRERASTTATCEQGQPEKQAVHVTLSALSDSNVTASTSGTRHVTEKTIYPKSSAPAAQGMEIIFSPKLSQKRGSKVKMGTIGVLCQQTMLSFDLGLSLQAEQQQLMAQEEVQHRKQGEHGKSPRPLSSGSEGEGPIPSPDDKKRPGRLKFFESSWLQKPRRFFKVSK